MTQSVLKVDGASNHDLMLVGTRPVWRRAAAFIVALALVAGAWVAGRWYMGSAVAAYAFDLDGAETALRWAPDDPKSNYAVGRLIERRSEQNANGDLNSIENDIRRALPYYERAAELAPRDFAYWLELGRARERAGQPERAVEALRRASEMAPAYAAPRWQLGNLLLRLNRVDEAFAELRRAGDADAELRPQIFNLAWRYYDRDVNAVSRVFGNSAPVRAELAVYLARQKRFDDAISLWSNLSPEDQRSQETHGAQVERLLFDARRFHDAFAVHASRIEMSAPGAPRLGQVANGGFEAPVAAPGASLFGWQIAAPAQTQINLDEGTFSGGARSLRIIFSAARPLDLRALGQTIVVEPNRRYRLRFAVRTDELRSVSTPLVEIADAADSARVLAASSPAPMDRSDWRTETIEFTAPATNGGVILRFNRAPCPDAVCPIFGRMWYDDFILEQVSGVAAQRVSR